MRQLTERRLRRVYAVCSEVPPEVVGGLGRYAERMMAALRQLDTPVEVFGTTGASGGTQRSGSVTLHRIRTRAMAGRLTRVAGLLGFNVRTAARILRADARRSGSVVAVHDWMGAPAGIACRLVGRRPVVFHVHTREPFSGMRLVAAGIAGLERAMARLADAVIVPSNGMRDELIAAGWAADRLAVVPHGFEDPELSRLAALSDEELGRVREPVRRRYLPGGEGELVVFAGRLSPHKGVGTLIRAAAKLVRERDRLRVVLVGGEAPRTGDAAMVARLIDELGVAGQVIAGQRFVAPSEVYAHFLAADVCAFPSTYEPFGLVAVEAMALGRPVVVGPGFSPEVVGDGAIRCERDSPEELAAALARCLDDRARAARLGARGAAYVRERYAWARTARSTLDLYAGVGR
jgi:glycosyltransferase involved in cell wall biosynthesis